METVGTVLKVQRRDAQILFQATWPAATVGGTTTGLIDIYAYVQPAGQNIIYGCGPKTNPATVPGIFRMDTDGSFKYFYMISATAPTVDCRGVTYEASSNQASFLMLTNS
jgi:hypothetical protein